MGVSLDRNSETPLYRQLLAELSSGIRSGEIASGSRLPSVRSLARTLGVSPITVVQAYNGLAADGLVHATVGRGTFAGASGPETARPQSDDRANTAPEDGEWHTTLPVHLRAPRISAMHAPLSPGRRPGVISLAAGTPDPSLFPIRVLGRLWSRVMAAEDPGFLQYGTSQGDYQLRTWIAARCAATGIRAKAEDILITSGSQQAIDLVARTFVGPGDYVLVESPTFITALDIFEGRGAKLIGVPMDNEGVRVDVAASLMERFRPRLMYTMPTAHNPTGITTTEDRRRQLAALARRYNLLVLEDDTCSEFTYDGEAPPAIKAFDAGGHVLFVLSFSKTVIPGLRIGCVVAQAPLLSRLVDSKSVADRFTSPLIQRTLWRYLSSSRYPRDLATARDVYRSRRNALLEVLEETMPTGVTWTRPSAGFNIWMHLPDTTTAAEVFEEGLKEGVACAPGDLFLPHAPPPSGLRISFADNPEETAGEGARRLARALTRVLASSRAEEPESAFVTTV